MLKKFISYTIIFSIFYSDALYCMDPDPAPAEKSKTILVAQKSSEKTSLLNLQVEKPRYNSLSSSTPSPRSDETFQGSTSSGEGKIGLSHLQDSKDQTSSDDSKDLPLTHLGDLPNLSLPSAHESILEDQGLKSTEQGSNATTLFPDVQHNDLANNTVPDVTPSVKALLFSGTQTSVQADNPSDLVVSLSSNTASQPLLPNAVPPSNPISPQLKINQDSDEDSVVDLNSAPVDKEASDVITTLTSKNTTLEDKLKLQQIKIYHIEDKSLWKQVTAITKGQWAAIGGGLVIGAMTTRAMQPVYNGGLFYLDDAYDISLISVENGAQFLSGYIIASAFFDAIPRNISLWKKAAISIAEKGLQKGRTALTTFVSFFPSLLEPAYLITTEMYILSKLDRHGIDNIYAQTMLIFSPFLLADSWAFNYDLTWEVCDEIKEWFETRDASYLFGKCLNTHSLSPEANIRQDFHKTLDKLSRYVFKMDPDDPYIATLEDTISNFEANIKAQFPDLEDENVDAAHTVFLMSHLLSLGDKVQNMQKHIKSCYESITDVITYTVLALGSPVRFFALRCGIEGFFEFLTSADTTQTCGLIGSSLGFLLLTAFEYKGLKNFFRDFLWHENPHAHGSHPWCRIGEKGLSAWTGLVFTLPLAVLSIQACDKWFSGQLWMYLLSIPYLFAEFTAQTTSFHDSYNRKIGTGAVGLYNNHLRERIYGEGPRNDFKKDRILQTIENMKKQIGNVPPFMLHILDQGLHAVPEELDEFSEKTVIQ